MSQLEAVKSVLATGGEHIGDVIFWSLADARIDRPRLEALWREAGLAADLLPDPPSAEKALKLAVRESQTGERERLIRLGKEDEGELIYAIVREHRSGAGDVSYSQEARLVFDRDQGTVASDKPDHDLVAAIDERFQVYRSTHTPDDVRRALVKTLHSFAAVTLREGGGIYWAPARFAEDIRKLQMAVEQIGSSRVYLLPIHRSPDAERTLGAIAKGTIEEELGALKAEIESFLSTPPERASTLIRRFDAFEALRARASLYRDVLHFEVADLESQLTRLSTTVEELLNQRSAA